MAIIVDAPSFAPRPRSIKRFLYPFIAILLLFTLLLGSRLYTPIQARFFANRYPFPGAELLLPYHSSSARLPSSPYTTTVVTGRLDDDPFQVDWIMRKIRDLTTKAIYIVDDPGAPLHLPRNHGRESMVYLRYILDHYDKLNDVTFFMHAAQKAWHNNLLHRLDSAVTVSMMNRSYVLEKGYVNTRCDTDPGCPHWIKFDPTWDEVAEHDTRFEDLYNTKLWNRIFPNVTRMPKFLSQPCCSQFAVSRERLRSVPRETYQRLVDWIEEEAMDGFTGRVMEYTWQYLFLGVEELCPDIKTCYCEQYGMCKEDHGLFEQWEAKVKEVVDRDVDFVALKKEMEKAGQETEGSPFLARHSERTSNAYLERCAVEAKLIDELGVPPLLEGGRTCNYEFGKEVWCA
ncbi:MAG: hypothetical protein M1828_006714 [Chrysothrix sp. TS-e1954]|nr:MAG: hypothetical protein M1828_006714 [Chrysothrix sp. TS-e1954]